ncbi:MAG: KH domain-containing protein [Acidimicrobiales bacterium]
MSDDIDEGGDVNTVDDMDEAGDINVADDLAGNRVEGGSARSVLDYITRSIATEPDAVVVEADDSGRGVRFRIHVAQRDMGRMIGRRGRVAQAIRTLVRVAGSRDGVETNVDFVDD